MKKEIVQKILDAIEDAPCVILMRHIRPDGDAVGATMGLRALLKATYPDKEIRIENSDRAPSLAFLGEEDAQRPAAYKDALGIVLDTATTDRIANKRWQDCKTVIRIDHHASADYGDLSWVEPEKSSACEMLAEMADVFCDRLKLNVTAATALYAGMVTDSGRFYFHSVTGDTMRLAGHLLDTGIDTDTLFAHLYLKEPAQFRFLSYIDHKVRFTPNGVAYLTVDRKMQAKYHLSSEEAGETVREMEAIRGSLIWIAFIETPDAIRVRLRSRFVTIRDLAASYGGGGHDCACGATVHNARERRALLRDADALVARYKATHNDWL